MEIKGFTYGYDGKRGDYRSERGIRSRELLFETGVNWMCLAFCIRQKNVFSTDISFDFARSCSDRDIVAAIAHAHENGIKVCLKPILNCDDGMWRANICFPDTEMGGRDVYWDKWFESYGNFMKYYAELAQETGCEMFCVGCEMCGTESKENHWRKLIADIREIYKGELIYNTNHGSEDNVNWFDAVDYIGTSAYFPMAEENGPVSREIMLTRWAKVREKMVELHEKWKRPIVFAEIGCRSAKGCAAMPWDFTHREFPHDEEEQALFYDTCFQSFADEPWFSGMFWWDWHTFIYETREDAAKDNGFAIHLKQAEEILKSWYTKETAGKE